jgi:hypothetical protein
MSGSVGISVPFSEPNFITTYKQIAFSDLVSNQEYKLSISSNQIILRDLFLVPERLRYLQTFYWYLTFGNLETGKTIVQQYPNKILS